MLAGMLLHVIEPPRRIDHATHCGAGDQRLESVVPHFTVLVFFHIDNFGGQFRAAARGRGECADVIRLAAAGGIKRRTIQRHPPQRLSAGTRNFLDVRNYGIEIRQK